jgi:tetratricopeptide (TPR) repeat protein
MEANRHDEALAAYEGSLQLNPGRFAAVKGAGRAAESAGKADRAATYYRQLLSLADGVDPAREPALAHARSFLAQNDPGSR